MVTTLGRTAGRAWDLAERYGMTRFCRNVRACEIPVLALEDPASDAFAAIVAESRRAVADDGAEAIVLGCAGMADLAARMTEAVGVPVIDGVAAATKTVEGAGRDGPADQRPRRVRTAPAEGLYRAFVRFRDRQARYMLRVVYRAQ